MHNVLDIVKEQKYKFNPQKKKFCSWSTNKNFIQIHWSPKKEFLILYKNKAWQVKKQDKIPKTNQTLDSWGLKKKKETYPKEEESCSGQFFSFSFPFYLYEYIYKYVTKISNG